MRLEFGLIYHLPSILNVLIHFESINQNIWIEKREEIAFQTLEIPNLKYYEKKKHHIQSKLEMTI